MCGEFGEVTVIIGLVINFLAFVSPLLSFRDTLSYMYHVCMRQYWLNICFLDALSLIGVYSKIGVFSHKYF